MRITWEDRTWFQKQILHYPGHWGMSMLFWGGVYGFARWFMQTNIQDACVWAFLGLFSYGVVAELNQHLIKSEYGIKMIDIIDAILDWVSWVFFPMMFTAIVGRF